VWDPTAHKIIFNKDIVCVEKPEGFFQDRNRGFVCMLEDSLYGLMVPMKLHKRFESFMVSQHFSMGKYDYIVNSTFTILMLFTDDMLVASRSMVEISKIKAQLDMIFQMKDQGAEKQILSTEIHRDNIHGKLWLSQYKSIVMKFSMNIVKHVNIPIAFHYKFSSSLGHVYKEEMVMSRILCVISVGGLLYAMKWLRPYISHSIDVVNHMSNLGEEVKWVLQSFRDTIVTYNSFSGLICGNYNLDFAGILDRRKSTSTYVSKHHLEDMLEVE
jgi:hypothetical protein